MSERTALEDLLRQAGFGKRKAFRLAEIIDAVAIPGMSADDLYTAFIRWRAKAGLTDSALRTMTADHFRQTGLYEKLRETIDGMVEDVKTGQTYFSYTRSATPRKNPITGAGAAGVTTSQG